MWDVKSVWARNDYFEDEDEGEGEDAGEWRFDRETPSGCDPDLHRAFIENLEKQLSEVAFSETICPYCSAEFEIWTASDSVEDGLFEHHDEWSLFRLEICPKCAYWSIRRQSEYALPRSGGVMECKLDAYVSKLNSFDPELPFGCSDELAVALRRRPELYHQIDPGGFEKFVADVFRANHSHAEVFHVGRSHDDGIDVIFAESGGHRWLVQVKRRGKPDSSEGVGTVRSLLGTMLLNNTLNGIIVSTADHFTVRAMDAAQRARKLGWTVNLIDRGKLDRMLDNVIPYRRWPAAFRELLSTSPQGWKEERANYLGAFACIAGPRRGMNGISVEDLLLTAGYPTAEQLELFGKWYNGA